MGEEEKSQKIRSGVFRGIDLFEKIVRREWRQDWAHNPKILVWTHLLRSPATIDQAFPLLKGISIVVSVTRSSCALCIPKAATTAHYIDGNFVFFHDDSLRTTDMYQICIRTFRQRESS